MLEVKAYSSCHMPFNVVLSLKLTMKHFILICFVQQKIAFWKPTALSIRDENFVSVKYKSVRWKHAATHDKKYITLNKHNDSVA